METMPLKCPVCGQVLSRGEHALSCSGGHSFDLARSGYCNLLLNSSAGRHGDDRMMVRARSEFLNGGYYDPLSAEVARLALKYAGNAITIIDAGCGEGKYTQDLRRAMERAGKTPAILGVDISKAAVEALAKRDKSITAVVASTAALPVSDKSTDLLVNLFAPFFCEEFLRVLRPGGIVLRAVPLEDHLIELKQAVYDKAYRNDVPDYEEEGFQILETGDLCYSIHLPSPEVIRALFQMTPYYYKTGKNDQEKLNRLTELTVTVQFRVIAYEKCEEIKG